MGGEGVSLSASFMGEGNLWGGGGARTRKRPHTHPPAEGVTACGGGGNRADLALEGERELLVEAAADQSVVELAEGDVPGEGRGGEPR